MISILSNSGLAALFTIPVFSNPAITYGFSAASVLNPAWKELIQSLGLITLIILLLGLGLNYVVARTTSDSKESESITGLYNHQIEIQRRIQKYSRPARIFHWIHAASFLTLIITGILFLTEPGVSPSVYDWSRLIHRVSGIIFIFAPLIELLSNTGTAMLTLRKVFTWGKDDLDWVIAVPGFYILSDDSALPPQDEFSTGQKLWLLSLLVFSPILVITGILMWILNETDAQPVFQISAIIHSFTFIAVFLMFLIHIYLDVIHPMVRIQGGSLKSMVNGTVTAEYARTHHIKWYDYIKKKPK
jgi:formate dehydrogenase subunit gamma